MLKEMGERGRKVNTSNMLMCIINICGSDKGRDRKPEQKLS